MSSNDLNYYFFNINNVENIEDIYIDIFFPNINNTNIMSSLRLINNQNENNFFIVESLEETDYFNRSETENEIINIVNNNHKYNIFCDCEKCKNKKISSIEKIKIGKIKKFLDDDLCCICLDTKNDNLKKIIDLGCNRKIKHLLCEKCFIEYKKNECPLCKKNINKNNLKILL